MMEAALHVLMVHLHPFKIEETAKDQLVMDNKSFQMETVNNVHKEQ